MAKRCHRHVVVAGFGLVDQGRVFRTGEEGPRAHNHRTLCAYVRNPLYLGSILLGVGFAVAARELGLRFSSWSISRSSMFPSSGLNKIICAASSQLMPIYAACAQPAPRKLWFGGVTHGFSRELYFRHREYILLLGAAAMLAVPDRENFLASG